jgi:hypothetical protein
MIELTTAAPLLFGLAAILTPVSVIYVVWSNKKELRLTRKEAKASADNAALKTAQVATKLNSIETHTASELSEIKETNNIDCEDGLNRWRV